MSGDEIRETLIEETARDLAAVYLRVQEHVVALVASPEADVTSGAGEVDARQHSRDLVKNLMMMQQIIDRVTSLPDVAATLPRSMIENAERTIRSSLDVAAIVGGESVPTYEELRAVAANEDPLMWAAQYERLSAFYDRAQELLDNVDAASERADERGMLLAITGMDDFIEDLDRDDDLVGRRDTAEMRQAIAGSRDRLAAKVSESSSTGHVVARRWTTEDSA